MGDWIESKNINYHLHKPGSVKTEFLDVSMSQLDSVTHNEVYKKQVAGFKESFINSYKNAPEPKAVADVIVKAITSEKPKTRYRVAGAGMLLVMKRLLPDKVYDTVCSQVMGQK